MQTYLYADLTPAQQEMLDENDEAGLGNWLAIPIQGLDASKACCTLVADNDGVDPQSYLIAHSLAVFAYASAQRHLKVIGGSAKLSKRERECLFLAARGKSDWVIGEMLGLSERTVHHTIERAKLRYGAATRVQAIVQAIQAGEFSATDALS